MHSPPGPAFARVPSILPLLDPPIPAPLPLPGLPPPGGPVSSPLGIIITLLSDYWPELLARGSTTSTNAREESVHLWTGRPPSFIDSPHAIYSFTTDETLARHRNICHDLHPMEAPRDRLQKWDHQKAFHKMKDKGLAHRTQKDHKPYRAWRRSLFPHQSLDLDPLVLFRQILAW